MFIALRNFLRSQVRDNSLIRLQLRCAQDALKDMEDSYAYSEALLKISEANNEMLVRELAAAIDERDEARRRLADIAAMKTPGANGTVRKMARVAECVG